MPVDGPRHRIVLEFLPGQRLAVVEIVGECVAAATLVDRGRHLRELGHAGQDLELDRRVHGQYLRCEVEKGTEERRAQGLELAEQIQFREHRTRRHRR